MKKRRRKGHHRRNRKEREGLLIQIDASIHNWFGETISSLHGAIDDATGKLCALHFQKTECLQGYFELAGQMIERKGIPVSIYSDRHTIFRSPDADKLSIEEQLEGRHVNLTQFGEAMEELGINVLFARSPQAKGRIERLWGTLQNRLPVECKIHGITTIEDANDFLNGYIDRFNEQFEVEPKESQSAFRPLDDSFDLSAILCVKEQRTVSDGSGFSYCGQYYQLMKGARNALLPRRVKVTVLDSHKGALRAVYNGVVYDTKPLAEKPRKEPAQAPKQMTQNKTPARPTDDHPWRAPIQKRPKLYYEESDREILEALFDSSRAWA